MRTFWQKLKRWVLGDQIDPVVTPPVWVGARPKPHQSIATHDRVMLRLRAELRNSEITEAQRIAIERRIQFMIGSHNHVISGLRRKLGKPGLTEAERDEIMKRIQEQVKARDAE